MAIFARRTLQRVVNRCAHLQSTEDIVRHVELLNEGEPESLASEWELAILFGFDRIAHVEHEPPAPDSGAVDLLLSSEANGFPLAAVEIRAVSDRGLKEENPLDDLLFEFRQTVSELEISGNRFSWRVGGERREVRKGYKTDLQVPAKGQIPSFMKSEVKPFLMRVAEEPNQEHTYRSPEEYGQIHINYNPATRYFSVSYATYREPASPTNNPVFNALKAKVRHLSRAGYDIPTGIIVCDSGCRLLARPGRIDKIIEQLFSDHSSVAFVVSTFVKRSEDFPKAEVGDIGFEIFENRNCPFKLEDSTKTLIEDGLEAMPRAVQPAESALHQLRYMVPGEGRSHYPGWRFQHPRFRFSSRVLMQLLAGKMEVEKFLEDHWLTPGKGQTRLVHPIEQYYEAGYTIQGVSLELTPEEDDDWIVLEFRKDPARSEFRVPEMSRADDDEE